VVAGRFREDFYFRLGRPEVRVPPLRERLDEVPWFVEREVRAVDAKLAASVTFVEACALRRWPGNVRELLREVRRAAHRAIAEGSELVEPEHLADDAGESLDASTPEPPGAEKISAKQWTDDEIARSLDEHGGNVRGTARALGMHRNQLRRWLAKRAGAPSASAGSTLPPSDE
jgi:transcriptional regulator of acetoin/glycerol metabolism